MGAWGYEPWDSDDAADWFAELISPQFVKKIEAALRSDPEDDWETIRAAAYVLQVLGHAYIWPVDKLAPQLKLAAQTLEQVQASGVLEEAELSKRVRRELKVLKQRLRAIQSAAEGDED